MKNLESILVKNQKQTFTKDLGDGRTITAKVRHDDECGNGHNTFSITGEITDSKIRGCDKIEMCGCIHDEIGLHFPDLAPLIKWHSTSTDGPLHYVSNSLYHASDRDHNGLLKGEKLQIKSGKTGLPCWNLVAVDRSGNEIDLYEVQKSKDSIEKPSCEYTLEFRPWCRVGEGKTPDLEAARSAAIWPEAELEEFTKENLEARLEGLMIEFKKAVESLGLKF